MEKRLKQGISFLLALMMVAMLFAGCGASGLLEEPADLASAVSNTTYATVPQSQTSVVPLQGASPPAAIRDIFPDEDFANSVVRRLRLLDSHSNWSADSIATQADLDQIDLLTSFGSIVGIESVESLEGIQHLRKLERLEVSSSRVSDLSPLSGLASLRDLRLNNNQISNLSPLSELVDLQVLRLGDNQINDITPLSGLVNLSELRLDNTQISDIAPLSELDGLRLLDLSGTQVRDITPLSKLVDLDFELGLRNIQLRDIAPLSGLVNLMRLDLSNNQISDLSPLSEFANLNLLDLRHNQIVDFSPISDEASFIGGITFGSGFRGEGQQVVLEPMLRTEVISISNMVRNRYGDPVLPDYISDGGIYENGTITWSGLTTQRSVSFSWYYEDMVPWIRFEAISGTVTIPLISPGSGSDSPIRLSRSEAFEFRPQAVGAEPSSLMTTVRNTAATWSDPLMVRLTGANASNFEFTHLQCPIPQMHRPLRDIWTGIGTSFVIPNIEPGGSTEFRLRTVPGLAVGTHTATVTVVGRGVSESFDLVIEVR